MSQRRTAAPPTRSERDTMLLNESGAHVIHAKAMKAIHFMQTLGSTSASEK